MKIAAPRMAKLDSILPDSPRLLMGAGPVPIPAEVANANGRVINHLGHPMNAITSSLQEMGKYIFQTSSSKIFGISGPASAAMEMAMSSLLWEGRSVLVLNLGTFSNRFAEQAKAVKAEVTELFPKHHMRAFTLSEVCEQLDNKHFDVLTIVQGETSCGVKNIELEQIAKYASAMGVLVVVDAVSTLTTMPLEMDLWGIDVVFTGGQKGLSSVAGVSMIAFSERAYKVVKERTVINSHWCLDPIKANEFWCNKNYHYTAPVSGLLALYEALRLIVEETLEARFKRHLDCSQGLQHCLVAMGLDLYAPVECRLNSVVAIEVPEKIDSKQLLKLMSEKYGVEISGAFGANIVRIGQMGEQCRPENIEKTVGALAKALAELGFSKAKDTFAA